MVIKNNELNELTRAARFFRIFLNIPLQVQLNFGFVNCFVLCNLYPEKFYLYTVVDKKKSKTVPGLLTSNSLYIFSVETQKHFVTVFDIKDYKSDVVKFFGGQYSKFSEEFKNLIKERVSKFSQSGKKTLQHSTINPSQFEIERLAKNLGVPEDIINGEIYSIPDVDFETLVIG